MAVVFLLGNLGKGAFLKKIVFIIFAIFLSVPIGAAQRCIDFGDLSMWLNEYNAPLDSVDWSLVWPHITVEGIGVCAETSGSVGDVLDTIEYDTSFFQSSNDNFYCWCRMLSPAVSKWVFHSYIGYADGCLEYCSTYCADEFIFSSDFREIMLGTLSN